MELVSDVAEPLSVHGHGAAHLPDSTPSAGPSVCGRGRAAVERTAGGSTASGLHDPHDRAKSHAGRSRLVLSIMLPETRGKRTVPLPVSTVSTVCGDRPRALLEQRCRSRSIVFRFNHDTVIGSPRNGEDVDVPSPENNTLTVPGGMTGVGRLVSTAGPAMACANPIESSRERWAAGSRTPTCRTGTAGPRPRQLPPNGGSRRHAERRRRPAPASQHRLRG